MNVIRMAPHFRLWLVLPTLTLAIVACGTSPQPTASPTASSPAPVAASPSETPAPEPPPDPNSADRSLISDTGIGVAQLGTTLGAVKQALGGNAEFIVQSPFIVDFDAIAVRQNGEVQFYILYLAGQPFTDEDIIQGVITDNPNYRTAEGIGVSTPLAKAEEVYGQATLSYHTQNESREYARFEQQPASNISFSTGNGNTETAGIYASPTQEYNETTEFRENASIQSVLVVCLTETCAAAESP